MTDSVPSQIKHIKPTIAVGRTLLLAPRQTAAMRRGRRVRALVGLRFDVRAVALRRDLAQRHHLQSVLLAARRHAVHHGASAVGLVVASA